MDTLEANIVEPRERHIHIAAERCPYCEQSIPNAKAVEIRARVAREKQQQTDALRAELTQDFQRDKAQAVAAAREAAETSARQSIDALKQGKAEEERQKIAAISQYESLKADQENVVNERVCEARDALQKDKDAEVGGLKARHFQETERLRDKLADATRQLEKKMSDELGEGAEINLFATLKAEFPDDKIVRIGKGESGADIHHTVLYYGKSCGLVIYDSKNSGIWRNDYVDKLARDQRAAKADHAILSTRKFPAQKQHLHLDDSVIIANPARVVALVQIIRQHIIEMHKLRLSNTERSGKTVALYEFITSPRCTQLLDAIDTHAGDLLQLQGKEEKEHHRNWQKQRALYRSIQNVRGDLCSEIDNIIGVD